MQTRYFKRLLPLTAVALLILAFLAIELTPGPCERRYTLATPNPEHSKEWEEITEQTQELLYRFTRMHSAKPYVWAINLDFFEDENGDILEVPDGEGGCKRVMGFVIRIAEKLDQSALSPEDRIPDMFEGIPVQIIEEPYPSWYPSWYP